ncbi:hypothetical protein CMI43_03300 [Candidatus Pacearchaeota archaeon]|nr:hypothetical protein [Candidatus Pacearchaeota archaeon]|tara:strand:+ start:1604 stop:1861 length:258 start_codon:yes stop_codon:yes gene_type:complete
MDEFKKNMDSWIKDFNTRLSKLEDNTKIFSENVDNTDHCHEMIYELQDRIEKLEDEINTLKLIQIIHSKKEEIRRLKNEKTSRVH